MAEPSGEALAERAEQLKERVYVTFSALAVTIALRTEHLSAGGTALTLLVAVLGTLLAVFVSDVIAHIAVHAALPRGRDLRHMLRVSLGSIGVVVVPLLIIGCAALGLIPLDGAITATIVALIAALVAVAYLAVRRLRLPIGQRLLVLLAEAALGLAVLALETYAH